MSSLFQGVNVPTTDPDSWVDRHGDVLYRFALARVGEPSAAEELVQEAFLAALRGLKKFSGQSAERTWLVGILKHKIFDWLRRKSRQQPSLESPPRHAGAASDFDSDGWWQNLPASWGNNPGAALENQEFWDVFRHCMGGMPHRLAAAFRLREMDGLSTEEISQQMAITSGNLGVLLHRARLALRRCLETSWFQTNTSEI